MSVTVRKRGSGVTVGKRGGVGGCDWGREGSNSLQLI